MDLSFSINHSIGVAMFQNYTQIVLPSFCFVSFYLLKKGEKHPYLLIRYDGDPNLMDHVRPPCLQENGCIHHTHLFACNDHRVSKGFYLFIFLERRLTTTNSNRRQRDTSPSSPAWLILIFTRRAISGHTMSVRAFRRSCNTQTHRLTNTHHV